jgi:hypothetical protein
MARAQGITQKLEERRQQGFEVAWVVRGGVIKVALSPWRSADAGAPRHSGLRSSVVALIEGIYSTEPRWSVAWVRGRIFTTEPAGIASAATVQVAARRVRWSEPWQSLFELVDSRDWDRIEEVAPPGLLPARPIARARALDTDPSPFDSLRAWRAEAPEPERAEELVPVVAGIRYGGAAHFGSARLNQARQIRTRHAEVQLVRDLLDAGGPGIGKDGRVELWVTLKCCKMCAAWVFEAFAGVCEFEVFYEKPDPGRLGRFTALEASSPQRLAAVRELGLSRDWLTRVVERRIESR